MTDSRASATDPSPEFTGSLPLVLRLLAVVAFVYLFILSITLLGDSFKLMGKGFAETVFHATANPVVGLFIGIFATSIIQSSSTTTSLIVGLVASGVLDFQGAVPMVMGANIGTTVTATVVSLGHISRGDEFRRAFAASTVHDFFNICSAAVLLPLQIQFNLIGVSSHKLEQLFEGFGGMKFSSPLGAITKPVSHWIIGLTGDTAWLAALIAMVLLFAALHFIVKILRSMVLGKVERFFQRFVFRTPALGLLLGIGLTVLVQSSSITTSIVVPLVGAGVITLDQIFPYLLGANVGTTITAFLASFVTGSPEAVSVAFAHFVFNVYGICIFWPLKRIPIFLAKTLSKATQRSKLIPVAFILVAFFVIPGAIIYWMR